MGHDERFSKYNGDAQLNCAVFINTYQKYCCLSYSHTVGTPMSSGLCQFETLPELAEHVVKEHQHHVAREVLELLDSALRKELACA